KRFWIAAEVGRPVIAELMQHDHAVARLGRAVQLTLQRMYEHFVHAMAVRTQAVDLLLPEVDEIEVTAYTLAATLVVQPAHLQAGTLDQMQQGFVIAYAFLVVIGPTEGREHAGHRHF